MRRLAMAAAIILMSSPLLAEWSEQCAVTITRDGVRLISVGRCWWMLGGMEDQRVQLRATHTISPNTQTAVCSGAGYCGTSLTVDPYSASTTYETTSTYEASQLWDVFATKTLTASYTTPDPFIVRTVDCPLVLDLNGDGIHTTGLDRPVFFFDRTGDGVGDATGWLLETSEDAFLWLDVDGDGRVSGAAELFGSHMNAPTREVTHNGFQALEVYDLPVLGGNGDGAITKSDAIWDSLRLWVDRDHDGASTGSEIRSLGHDKIVALDLAREHEHLVLPDGNGVMLTGSYTRRVVQHGGANTTALLRMDDISFVRATAPSGQ